MKRVAAFFFIGLLVTFTDLRAETFGQGEEVQALPASELAQYRGGFVLPNGLQIDIGVSVQTSIGSDGISAASPALGSLGTSVPIASAAMIKLSGQQQVQTFVQAATTNAGTTVQNALNNAVIQQLTSANIDIANFSKIEAPANAALANLGSQIRSSAMVGLH